VGGVSESAGAKAGGITPFAFDFLRVRDGERHPGSRKGSALRGALSARESWSVRHPAAVSSAAGNAPMTADARRYAEEGNVVGMRLYAYAPGLAYAKSVHDASGTRPSLGPSTRARQSSLCSGATASEVRRTNRHHGWANPREWEQPSLGPVRTDDARLAACHRFHKEEGVARQKRKEVEASVPARVESRGLVARTS